MQSKDVRVDDIIRVMEQVAPPELAEQWDNCGLQVGSRKWPVKKIWVALDPLLPVIKAAIDQKVDMVVTHHPLIFQPLTQVNLESDVGCVIGAAIKGRAAIFAAHTNLDSTLGGINDVLAREVGMQDVVPLLPAYETSAEDDGTESMQQPGLGRVGRLASPVTVGDLATQIKSRLGSRHVKVAGKVDLSVQKAAVCSGSGAGLLDAFLASDAQVYISGDLKYHNARVVEASGRALIDVGHFASEHIMIDALAIELQNITKAAGWSVTVEACPLEQDPFIEI